MATDHAQRSGWRNELLPHIVDRLSRESPGALYAEYPVSPLSYNDGYRKVTYRDLANAVNGAAWWLSGTLGPSQEHEVLTYVGPNDLRYIVLVLASVKAGYVLFLTSPRNSVAAHQKLFERLGCTKLLSPEPRPPSVGAILDVHSMRHVVVPSVADLLDKTHRHYAYKKKFFDARSEPFMIIHTSGSTGFPKPLVYTHETAARNMNMLARDPPANARSMDRLVQGTRVLNCFPPFHGACLVSHLFAAIPFGTVMIAPLAEAISTARGVADALHQTAADAAFLVPSIVMELSQDDELLDYCSRKLQRCLYAGGDLPQATGDKVASRLQLICQYGASEIGLTPQLLPDAMGPCDWKYVHFHPCLGTEFEEVADGVYELCVRKDTQKENEQPTFTIFPDLQEYRSRDLFKRHPTLPELWSWCARADDIIVFSNGEKTNPVSTEQHILARNPGLLAATIVIGAQRFQAALMLEPAPNAAPENTAEEAAFIEKIWPSVEEANKTAPAHARIEKAMILPMHPDKPVIRAGKGTIQRAATIQQYSAELDRLYQNADMGPSQTPSGEARDLAQAEILQIVKTVITQTIQKVEINDRENFFTIGIDSLQALTATRKLRHNLRMSEIAISTLYSNPSVAQLSEAIHSLQVNRQTLPTPKGEPSRAQRITPILQEYQARIREIPQSPERKRLSDNSTTVVLTGSTGTLGTYLLGALLDDPEVGHIYCLNRRHGSDQVQRRRSEAAGLPITEAMARRVTFLKADLAEPKLGLPAETYESIRLATTLIVHNAWSVNFNLPLPTFRPLLTGLVNLLALSAAAHHQTPFFFVSSISSVLGIRTTTRSSSSQQGQQQQPTTPEEVFRDNIQAPYNNGYAESKFVAEVLCDEAARCLRIPVSLARVGQIAGPVRREEGAWNRAEWFPSLITSSLRLGCLPDSLGPALNRVAWVPVDLLAEIVADLCLHRQHHVPHHYNDSDSTGAVVFHLQNPHFATWTALLPGIQAAMNSSPSSSSPSTSFRSRKRVDIVSAHDWLARLRRDLEQVLAASSRDENEDEEEEAPAKLLAASPATKLLDFFADNLTADGDDGPVPKELDLTRTLAASAPLRALQGVGNRWTYKWIRDLLATVDV